MKFSHYFRPFSVFLLLACATSGGIAQNSITKPIRVKKPDNIILFIGDGMGVTQVYAGFTKNQGQLNLMKFTSLGFSLTYSASDYITDSGAGGTAISTGNKTYNGAIGVDRAGVPSKTILEFAEEKGLSTGLVSTSSITHATPASFIAHEKFRDDYEAIAADFLDTDIDVFIGGGRNNFTARKDKRNLVQELRDKGYQVIYSMDSVTGIQKGKLAGLVVPEHAPSMLQGRGDMLTQASVTAINILNKNRKGFFLMVEGSQIDWGGHANNTDFVVEEMIDLDKAIGKAMEFAEKDRNTLVIVTADHETGGMAILDGDYQKGTVTAKFGTTDHTGVMVPVFAWGPGAELFQGIQENTDIFKKMMLLLELNPEPPVQQ
ncbi:MAG: alkaline phosphatase [Bacteroidales bacterium]|nr:alkaline phosphatase [Bacteroidales bacterium]